MDMRLHLLVTSPARGSDGRDYKLMGYERMVRDESVPTAIDHWEPTGEAEYRLEDGRMVEAAADGTLRIAHTDVTLSVG